MKPSKKRNNKSWASEMYAITLFIEDKNRTKSFYEKVLGLAVEFEDDVSVVFRIGDLLINFLIVSAANELIAPAKVGERKSGSHLVLTIHVKDVDTKSDELKTLGTDLLTEPIDRPWGIRTVNFADPDGYIWEIASPIEQQ